MLDFSRWVLGTLGAIVFVGFAVSNIVICVAQHRKPRGHSLLPVVGGLLGACGVVLLPIPGIPKFFWVPLILDLGCGPLLILSAVQAFTERNGDDSEQSRPMDK